MHIIPVLVENINKIRPKILNRLDIKYDVLFTWTFLHYLFFIHRHGKLHYRNTLWPSWGNVTKLPTQIKLGSRKFLSCMLMTVFSCYEEVIF